MIRKVLLMGLLIVLGFNDTSTLVGHCVVEETVEEMKERDREERGKWKKVKEQKE